MWPCESRDVDVGQGDTDHPAIDPVDLRLSF